MPLRPSSFRNSGAGLALLLYCCSALASEPDAVAISANIRARHMPFGAVLDPMYASAASPGIVGYTRCGDSALWTGAFLAAESFRYKVTSSPDALSNVKFALAGLKGLTDVTGDNRLARCMVLADSPFAAGIAREEVRNSVHQAPPWIWIDNTSRDQIVGAFFGLAAAFDFVDDASVKAAVSDLATRLLGFVSRHQWSPNDDLANTFLLRPEELQMLLLVTKHVNPADSTGRPILLLPLDVGVTFDVQSDSSYFKFNLDYLTFHSLLRLDNSATNQAVYRTLRNHTQSHGNAFFNMVDRTVTAPDEARDRETRRLLDEWLQRSSRDFYIDLTKAVPVCGTDACQPIPVNLRTPADFLWQISPFQLTGGGGGTIEGPGIDYILPYWMGRYYGVISNNTVQSAAAPSRAVAPESIVSFYGAGLSAVTQQAMSQPLPTLLGGVSVKVTDAAGAQRDAPLLFVSPNQINLVVPSGIASGSASFAINGSTAQQTATVFISNVAPTLFSMNGMGSGVAAATAIRTSVGNPQEQSPVPVFQCAGSTCSAVPISLDANAPVYVTFYGTGIRNRAALADITASVNGVSAPVLYAGPAPNFTGLDQVNISLPLSLRGSGEASVVVSAGAVSNTVTIDIQ